MTTATRIRNNSIFAFVSQALRMGTNVILFIGIARLYGSFVFGEFTTAHVYVTFFYFLGDFGIDLFLLTEVARDRAGATESLNRLLPLKLIFCFSAAVLMAGVAYVAPVSHETKILMWILSMSILGNGLTTFFLSALKGLELFQYETYVSFIQNASLLGILIILGILHWSILLVAIGFVVSRFLGVVYVIRVFHRASGSSLRLTLHGWRKTFKRTLPFGVHLLFGTLFFTIDTIIISIVLGERAVGSYQAVFKVAALALVASDIVISSFVPILSRFYTESFENWKTILHLLTKLLVAGGIGGGLVFFLFPEWCLMLIYGRNMFQESIPIMKIFGIIIFVRYASESFGLMLTTSMRQDVRMKVVVIAALMNIALNLLCINRFGVVGVAIVSLLTNLFVGGCFLTAAAHFFSTHTFLVNRRLILLLALTSAGAGVLSIASAGEPVILIAGIGVCMGAWLGLLFTKREREQILVLLFSRKNFEKG